MPLGVHLNFLQTLLIDILLIGTFLLFKIRIKVDGEYFISILCASSIDTVHWDLGSLSVGISRDVYTIYFIDIGIWSETGAKPVSRSEIERVH
jgi:hypothetical protein